MKHTHVRAILKISIAALLPVSLVGASILTASVLTSRSSPNDRDLVRLTALNNVASTTMPVRTVAPTSASSSKKSSSSPKKSSSSRATRIAPTLKTVASSSAPAQQTSSSAKAQSMSSLSGEQTITLGQGETPYDFSAARADSQTHDVRFDVDTNGTIVYNHEFLNRPSSILSSLHEGTTFENVTTAACLQAIRQYPQKGGTSLQGTFVTCIRTGNDELVTIAKGNANTVRYRILATLGKEGPGTIQTTNSAARYAFATRSYGNANDYRSYDVELFSNTQEVEVRAENEGMAIETVYAAFDKVTALQCAEALQDAKTDIKILAITQPEMWSFCVRTPEGYIVKLGAASASSGKGNAKVKFYLWRTSTTALTGDRIPLNGQNTYVDLSKNLLVLEKEPYDMGFNLYPGNTAGNDILAVAGETNASNAVSFVYPGASYDETSDLLCTISFQADNPTPTTMLDNNRVACFKTAGGLRGKIGNLQGNPSPSVQFQLWTGTPPALPTLPAPKPVVAHTFFQDGSIVSKNGMAFLDFASMKWYEVGDIEQTTTLTYDLSLGTNKTLYHATKIVHAYGKPDPAKNWEAFGIRFAVPGTDYDATTSDICKRVFETDFSYTTVSLTPHTKVMCFLTDSGTLGKLGKVKLEGDFSFAIAVWKGVKTAKRIDFPGFAREISGARFQVKDGQTAYFDFSTMNLRSSKTEPHTMGLVYDAKTDALKTTDDVHPGQVRRVRGKKNYGLPTAGPCLLALDQPFAPGEDLEITPYSAYVERAPLCFETSDGYVGALFHDKENKDKGTVIFWLWRKASAPKPTQEPSACPFTKPNANVEAYPLFTCINGSWDLLTCEEQKGTPVQDEQSCKNGTLSMGSVDAQHRSSMTYCCIKFSPQTMTLKIGDTSDPSLQYVAVNQTTYVRQCKKKRFAGVAYKTVCSNIPQASTAYTLNAIGNAKIASLTGTAFDAVTEDQCSTALAGKNTGNSMPFSSTAPVACVQFPDGSLGKAGKSDATGVTVTRWPKTTIPNI